MANRSATKILKSTSSFVAMLTAGVLMAPAASFAIDAGELPQNGTVVGGSANFDYGTPNKLDVHQNTDRVVIDWDSFNIGTDATTQFYQPGSKSLAVNRVYSKGADPTQILGKLIANGKVMVLDRNGVIFGKDAVVDVGGIIASTGDINVNQVMSGADKVNLNNFGSGSIINNGLINAADSGLVALVGPTAINNGVINAKVGKVALAAGEKATVDLYGDGLVEIAADSNLQQALIENKGTINAEGGTVQITAQAAKDAVDNVINMDGVVDVSSVTVEGGKIILGGNGTANIKGKLKSSNGKIDIKAKNINVADTAQISNNGDNATVDIIAEKHTDFRGAIQAVGGDVEVSGKETLGFTGIVQADNLLLDPEWAIIHSGALNNPLGLGYVLSAQALANSMELGTTINVQADDFIDIGVRTGGYSTGNPIVDAIINAAVGTLGAGDIDLSKYNYSKFQQTGTVFGFPIFGFVNYNGTTQGSIRFNSDTVNLNKNLIMGNGSAIVNAETLNLNAKIYDKDKTTLLGDGRLTGTSILDTINVGANGNVQQGINFADDATDLTTVNIAGTHKENITIAKNNIKLAGALGAKLEAATGGSLVTVTGDNVNIDPIVFDGLGIASHGINATGADNLVVDGNTFLNFTDSGIRVEDSDNAQITANTVYNTGSHGIHVLDSSNVVVSGNAIGTLGLNNNINGDGVLAENSAGIEVSNNTIKETTRTADDIGSGVHIKNSNDATVNGNTISQAEWDGVKVTGGAGVRVLDNDISGVTRVGVYSKNGSGLLVQDNTIDGTGLDGIRILNMATTSVVGNDIDNATKDGIYAELSNNILINDNTIGYNFIAVGNGNGITVLNSSSADVTDNHVANVFGNGIFVDPSPGTVISGNYVDNTGSHGIYLLDSINSFIQDNFVGTVGGANNIGGDGIFVNKSGGTEVSGNVVTKTKADGIHLLQSKNSDVTGNTVSVTGRNGIGLESSTGSEVSGNRVTDAGKAGIYAIYTQTVDILNNIVNGAGENGIYSINSNGGVVTISDNSVDRAGLDGIRVQVASNAVISGNTIGYGSDGLFDPAVDNVATIGRDGIRITDSDNTEITDNEVANTKRNGIYSSYSDGVLIDDNNVDNAGNHGVYLLESTNTDITNNVIGALGSAGNIKVDGIMADKSTNAFVKANLAAQTVGDGIHLLQSKNSEVSSNSVFATGRNGIGLESSTGSLVQSNSVINAGKAGIYNIYTMTVDILNNVVRGAGDNGIYSINSNGGVITISGNRVDNAALDGIRVQVADNAIISGNTIGYGSDGAFDPAVDNVATIGRDGIRITDSSNTEITDNEVANAKRNGIYSSYSDGVLIDGNTVDNTGNTGVYLLESTNTDITNNLIGTLGLDNNINGDGVLAQRSTNATVSGNTIAATRSKAADIGSGVHILQSDNSVVSNNTISNAEWDGVKVTESDDVEVSDNTINDIVRVGVYSNGSDDFTVTGNDITNADLYGVRVLDMGGVTLIDGNNINDIGTDGISAISTANLIIQNNFIGAGVDQIAGTADDTVIGNDGIHVANALLASVLDNIVANAARAGVYVGVDANTATVSGNEVTDSDIGMYFESGLIDLTGDANTITGGRVGYHFEPTGVNSVNLVGNTIGSSVFNGQSQYYVELANGALFNPGTPTIIDGTLASYDGFVPNSVGNILTQAEYDNLENRIFHFNDVNTLGLFFFGDVPGIDQSDLFRDINGVPGVAGRFSITIRGLPRIAGVTAPTATANAGGGATTGFSLNDITPAAGGEEGEEGASNQAPATLQNIAPAAGASNDVVEAQNWNAAIDAASRGQVVSYSFSGDGSDVLRGL